MKNLMFFVAIVVLALVLNSGVVSSAELACEDYEIIFIRGSGQKLNDTDFRFLKSAVEEKIDEFTLKFYELGENGGYDAIAVSNISTALGAYISAGESYKFGESVERGVKELAEHIKTDSKKCKNRKYVIVGYSQGAMVLDKTLSKIDSKKVLYAATFGDPKLYLPEGKTAKQTACKRKGLSPYRVYVPDCHVIEGVLSGINPYQTSEYEGKIGVWCNKNDFMCGSSLKITDIFGGHTSYPSENGYKKFAEIIFDKMLEDHSRPLEEKYQTVYSDEPLRDVIFIYDLKEMYNDLSIRRAIKAIPDDIKDRLVELTKKGVRVAVYTANGYDKDSILEERIPFTIEDLDLKIDEFNEANRLFNGKMNVTPGNNIYHAIKALSEEGDWRLGAERELYIYTNHITDRQTSDTGVGYKRAMLAAMDNNVKVSFMSKDGIDMNWKYQEIIAATGGIAIHDDFSLIKSEKAIKETNQISKIENKTFKINQNSAWTLVIVNDVVYGFSSQKEITIMNLDSSKENIIILIPYGEDGEKRPNEVYLFNRQEVDAPGVPDCGLGSF